MIKIRASQAGKLLTDPRSKKDKEAGVLSQTAKTLIKEIFLRKEYKYDPPVVTPQMLKGHLCEQDVMDVLGRQLPSEDFRIKNIENFENDYFTGTPDVILKSEGIVEDIKSSWTAKTFMDAEVSKDYYAQLQVYMELTGTTKARLIYCLVDTPKQLVDDEARRFFWKYGSDENNKHYLEAEDRVLAMHTPSLYIPEPKRIKYFEIEKDPELIDELERRIHKARVFYNTLTI